MQLSNCQEVHIKSYLKVLGTVQDGGVPHLGCLKSCCQNLSDNEKKSRKVTALGIIQPSIHESILFEATPDIVSQWEELQSAPKGIFLTHAHMGHYSGLLHLGREALGAKKTPVFVMPKMKSFLQQNAPWSQLVELNNVQLQKLSAKNTVMPLQKIEITPILVPHRDEFSETVGYFIKGPNKKVLFIPDIDKWDLWEENLIEWLNQVDYAFLDATFYSGAEMNFRDISEIPHPFIIETMALFKDKPKTEKNKLIFIHLNHTNPALDPLSTATKEIEKSGFQVARINQVFTL